MEGSELAGPDGGRGWLVVAACFLTTFTLDGIGYSFGMFMDPLMEEMEEGNFGISSIGSIQVAVYLASGPVVAVLVGKWGARPVCMLGSTLAGLGLLVASAVSSPAALLACYSLLGGVGLGFMYLPALVAAQPHFTRRRALAAGLTVAGTGVGTLVLPLLVECWIRRAGWRGALRWLAGLCGISLLWGAAMLPAPPRPSPPSPGPSATSEQQWRAVKGWRRVVSWVGGVELANSSGLQQFLFVMLGDFLATQSLYIPYCHLPDLAITRGVPPARAAALISAAGLSSCLGRVGAGLAVDRGLHPLTLTLAATAAAALQAALLAVVGSFSSFLVLSAGFGAATGAWVACETPLIISTLGLSALAPAFGLLTAGGGLAALTGAPLAGLALDSSSHPGAALLICAAIMASSAAVYGVASAGRALRARAAAGYEQIH